MTEDPRCCGSGTCIIDTDGRCWCGQQWDGEKMCHPPLRPSSAASAATAATAATAASAAAADTASPAAAKGPVLAPRASGHAPE